MSGEVKEFPTHFVVTCDDKASFDANKCVTYTEGDVTSVTVDLEVGGRVTL